MARREPVAPVKLAFFVEGDADKAFVEGLVPRVLGPNAQVRVVRVGGKAAFSTTFLEAAQFLQAGYDSIFLLVDADTEIPDEIEFQKQRLEEVFRRYGIEERVQIHIAVPMLEAWLLAAFREDPEQSTHPKRDLYKLLGEEHVDYRALAAKLPIEVARRRSRSFDELVKGLEAFAPRRHGALRRAFH